MPAFVGQFDQLLASVQGFVQGADRLLAGGDELVDGPEVGLRPHRRAEPRVRGLQPLHVEGQRVRLHGGRHHEEVARGQRHHGRLEAGLGRQDRGHFLRVVAAPVVDLADLLEQHLLRPNFAQVVVLTKDIDAQR